jgi:hypothetical protein
VSSVELDSEVVKSELKTQSWKGYGYGKRGSKWDSIKKLGAAGKMLIFHTSQEIQYA